MVIAGFKLETVIITGFLKLQQEIKQKCPELKVLLKPDVLLASNESKLEMRICLHELIENVLGSSAGHLTTILFLFLFF